MNHSFFSNNTYRHWLFALIIALLLVFGLVLVSIIYEEWTVSSDNIINNLNIENIGFYWHFSHPLVADKNWQTLPVEIKSNLFLFWPDFFTQEKLIANLSAQEYAYVIFNSDNKNDFAWLVYWPQQILPELSKNLTATTSSNLLIISQQAEEIKNKYFSYNQSNKLTKTWPYLFRPSGASYGYIDFGKMPIKFQDNPLNLTNKWRFDINDNYIEIASLAKVNNFINENKNQQWFDAFYEEDELFFNLKADELIWLWQQDNLKVWSKYLNELQNITGINIDHELINLGGYYNLVFSSDSSNIENKIPAWLMSLPVEKKVEDLITQAISKILGFLDPKIKETVLPDQSIIKEYIITAKNFDYQFYNLAGQNINIVYFNPDDYILYTQLDNNYIVGNSLKLLNRLITKTKGQKKRNICQNNPTASYSFKINQQVYILSYWHTKKETIFRFCY